MKTGKRKSKPENAKDTPRKRTLAGTLTLTATLVALGTSLGVDVNTLFAAEPMSEEGKLAPAVQYKETPVAVQQKFKGDTPPLQDKMQGTPPAARQLKIDGLDSGPVGTKVPGAEIPAR
jgi:hypothetical protein